MTAARRRARAGRERTVGTAFDAVLFDMDGVVTRTAGLHAAAWKELFDDFLRRRAAETGEPFRPFDEDADYRTYVDGKPRQDGARSFLAARDIEVPYGEPSDPPSADTVQGLAKRKDLLFERHLKARGVELFDSTLTLIRNLRAAGVRIAVVTSSRHGRQLLAIADIAELFDVRLDGNDLLERHIAGKPSPDSFLACAADLGTSPARSIVVEDAASGVAAGRAGGFGLVVGVDRGGNRDALASQGADVVVSDLGELDVPKIDAEFIDAQQRVSWRIEQEGFDPRLERDVESIFTLGNGYLGVRGALDMPLPSSQGDMFIAGIYDRKDVTTPYSELEFLDPEQSEYAYGEIVSFPFPFRIRLALDGKPVSLGETKWRQHRRVLDMQSGMLAGEAIFEVSEQRRATVRTRRCASRADLHLLLQEIRVSLENYSGTIELDASTEDPTLGSTHPYLKQLPAGYRGEPDIELRCFNTEASDFETCVAIRTTLAGSGEDRLRWRVPAAIGETLTFLRYITVYTSRDTADPQAEAVRHVREQSWDRFDEALHAHRARWKELWRGADIRVTGSPAAEQALRFHVYHLSSAADSDPRVSVGGRALTGRAYEGHVFWDVEIFLLPFFLHTQPEVARHLLLYRQHTLEGARRRARGMGQRGACYAWESTVTGDDVTPRVIMLKTTKKEIPIFTGTQQIHVTADVAYGVWRYWEATHDQEFLSGAGAEILAETARFWSSRCTPAEDGYHILGVVGPDEYHHGVNDNAYTNWMARFNLEKAVWVAGWLQSEFPDAWNVLAERIGLEPREIEEWSDVARRLYCPGPNEEGVIEQFEGFFELEDYPLSQEERFKAPIDRLFDWERINRLKLLKQADVLMLPFLFPDRLSPEVLAANYRYYEPLTDHGSSLSPPVHAALAARIGLYDKAVGYWQQSLSLDLSNVMGNSTLGIHPACMAATWQALVFHILGVRFGDEGPTVAAEALERLPGKWQSVALKLAWRGRSHSVEVRQ